MGSGFTSNPPDEGTTLTPAADVPPESFISQSDLNTGLAGAAQAILKDPVIGDLIKVYQTQGALGSLAHWVKYGGDIVAAVIKYFAPYLTEIGQAVVDGVTPSIAVISDIFGALSKEYVTEITRHFQMVKGGGTQSSGTPVGNAAQVAFDSLVSPIATFVQGTSPDQDGAGEKNYQQTLGVIVQIHLVTWVINVVSNLTGLGALHYINSFNEVILASLNARSLSRLGMRPYVDTFIATPLKQDLNVKFPIQVPSPASDVKEYLRGSITNQELIAKMAKNGFSPAVVAQYLLDTAKLLSPVETAWAVRVGVWTIDQGVTYLKQTGYDDTSARLALNYEYNSLVFENNKAAADAMGAHYAKLEVDDASYRKFLSGLGFNDLEVQSYITKYGVELEFPKPLTYTQLQNLYKEGLVDLDFVRAWMVQNQNAEPDIDLLILLDFTTVDQRNAVKAALAATARVASVKEAAEAATATTKGEAALAAALNQQSAAKAALAAKYGK